MRREWRKKGYAEGVAHVVARQTVSLEGELSGVCRDCGGELFAWYDDGVCAGCVDASLEYSHRHGILGDALLEEFADGVHRPRIEGQLVRGFMEGVRAQLAGVAR